MFEWYLVFVSLIGRNRLGFLMSQIMTRKISALRTHYFEKVRADFLWSEPMLLFMGNALMSSCAASSCERFHLFPVKLLLFAVKAPVEHEFILKS